MKKIGLIADPHANPAPVAEALAIFHREQVDAIWCTAGVGAGNQACRPAGQIHSRTRFDIAVKGVLAGLEHCGQKPGGVSGKRWLKF